MYCEGTHIYLKNCLVTCKVQTIKQEIRVTQPGFGTEGLFSEFLEGVWVTLRPKSEQLAFMEENMYCVIMQYIHETSIIHYNMYKQHEYISVLTQMCGCTYMCGFLSILFIHQSKMNLATSLLTRQTTATQTFGSLSDLIQFLFANTLSQCSLIF